MEIESSIGSIWYYLSFISVQPTTLYAPPALAAFPADVLVVPLAILAATYVLAASSQSVLLTSIAMYAAIWHRGRQSLGIARFYQRQAGGPISPLHSRLFFGAIYLPMVAAIFLYGHLAPENYEGEPYYTIGAGAELAGDWAYSPSVGLSPILSGHATDPAASPIEHWARATNSNVASGRTLGCGCTCRGLWQRLRARCHECFVSFGPRRPPRGAIPLFHLRHGEVANGRASTGEPKNGNGQSEIRFAASFALWPLIGLAGAIVAGWYQFEWLAPLGVGGLFCHYWLDGRIWTRRSMCRPMRLA